MHRIGFPSPTTAALPQRLSRPGSAREKCKIIEPFSGLCGLTRYEQRDKTSRSVSSSLRPHPGEARVNRHGFSKGDVS